ISPLFLRQIWNGQSSLRSLKGILNFAQEHREVGIPMKGFTQSLLVPLLLKVGNGFMSNISDLVHFGLKGEPLRSILKLEIKTCRDENTATFVLVSYHFDERKRFLTERIEFCLWRRHYRHHPCTHQHFTHETHTCYRIFIRNSTPALQGFAVGFCRYAAPQDAIAQLLIQLRAFGFGDKVDSKLKVLCCLRI